jgi:uncharacterized membrane protein YozB (DUF420 family)
MLCHLTLILRWLAVVLILRVLCVILANYPDYFPPNFDSLFLQGREATFHGTYRVAFYVHILTAPIVLVLGLLLLSETLRGRYPGWHRRMGRFQVLLLLGLMLPSSVVMSYHAFGGWLGGLSFLLLSLTTAGCALLGIWQAWRRRFEAHRRWMLRCYVLICSAVTLRLLSGTASLLEVPYPESAYIIASWSSWLIPLVGLEVVERTGAWRKASRFNGQTTAKR